jgi:hypothetical protein
MLVHREHSQVERGTIRTLTRAEEQEQGRTEQTARQVEEVMVEMVFQVVFRELRPTMEAEGAVDGILDHKDLAG